MSVTPLKSCSVCHVVEKKMLKNIYMHINLKRVPFSAFCAFMNFHRRQKYMNFYQFFITYYSPLIHFKKIYGPVTVVAQKSILLLFTNNTRQHSGRF